MNKTTFSVMFFMLAISLAASAAQTSQANLDPWPKTAEMNDMQYTVYHPQVDTWDGYNLTFHVAVSVLAKGWKEPVFGAIVVTAKTDVDKQGKTVSLRDVTVVSVNFPSDAGMAPQYQKDFQTIATNGPTSIHLARLEGALAVNKQKVKGAGVRVKNDPPAFIFSQKPAILASIDGSPAWRTVKGSDLQRVINTRALILKDPSGRVYLHLFDGFVTAATLSGPWKAASSMPSGAGAIADELAREGAVDLMSGPPKGKDPTTKPSLKNGVPVVYVVTRPTELLVTEGTPSWVSIDGTRLLYVDNTTGNIFKSLTDQKTYVLVTGRWFSAPGFSGPWKYVPAYTLPEDFGSIPDASPKENVKASIPGTMQAQEALISNQIPQTAKVNRSKASYSSKMDGQPVLKPISGTPLSYVSNSPDPIIMVAQDQWYSVKNGVWFSSPTVQGPWTVAVSVPPVIFSIPPDSPLYYVTFVQIYDVTPEYVVVGYTPGYMGTVVTENDIIVYGTGYYYDPYIGQYVWYPAPVTYGYATSMVWTPWTGWAYGYGCGWGFGAADVCYTGVWVYAPAPYWGPMPYSSGYAVGPNGAAAWGPSGWAATTGNVYQHWGSTTAVTRTSAGYNAWNGNAWSSKVGTSYNSVTGRISAGQKASVSNAYTGQYASGQRGATYNPSTGVGARGGTVTYGNAKTGSQNTATWGKVSGPGGQSSAALKTSSGSSYYADQNGNVYKNTGSGWEKYNGNGSFSSVSDNDDVKSLQSQKQANDLADQRSASSAQSGKDWGGGFSRPSGGYGEGGIGSRSAVNEGFDKGESGARSFQGDGFGGFHGGGGGFRR